MEERRKPDGAKILGLLLELYADQMGVKIKYEIVEREAIEDA